MIARQGPLGYFQIDRRHLFEGLNLLQGEIARAIHFDHVWRGLTGNKERINRTT